MDIPFRIDFPAGSFAIVTSENTSYYYGEWYCGSSNDEVAYIESWDVEKDLFDKYIESDGWCVSEDINILRPSTKIKNLDFFSETLDVSE